MAGWEGELWDTNGIGSMGSEYEGFLCPTGSGFALQNLGNNCYCKAGRLKLELAFYSHTHIIVQMSEPRQCHIWIEAKSMDGSSYPPYKQFLI